MNQRNQKTSLGIIPTALLIVALILVFVAERVLGQGDVRRILLGLGGAAFVAALVFRIQVVSAAQGLAKRAERALLFATAGIGVGLVLYVLSTDWALDLLGLRSSARERLDGVLAALWPAFVALSFFTLVFMELVYRKMPLAEAVEYRRIKMAAQAGLGLAFALIFVFSVNYVASQRDIKRDLSYFKTTRPSETSIKLVKKLDQPLNIVLFYRDSDDVLAQVRPYFDDLSRNSKSLKVKVMDHALAPKFARDQRVEGNGVVLMVRGKEVNANAQSERFTIGTDFDEARSKLRTLDATFQERFTKLTRPARSVHMTVGHGERNAGDREGYATGDGTVAMKGILGRFNIQTSNLGMAQGLASRVPESAGAVAVIGPRDKFLPEEAAALLRFVQEGGRLLLTLDPDVDVGLDPLLAGLGVKMLPGVVNSEQFYVRRTHQPSDRGIVYSKDYSSHPTVTTASRSAREIATIFVNGGALTEVTPKPNPSPTINFALKGPAQFWRDLNGNFTRDSDEPLEAMNFIAAVTFQGKNGREGRAVIIPDGDFVTDKVLPNNGNLLPFIDSLRWLVGEEDLSGDLSSEEDIPIEHSRDEDKVWFYLTTFAVPVPVALIGFWASRRRRKKE